MGKVMSYMNPIRNFNVESRAHKVISQAKPVAAPKYKTDQMSLENLMKEYPEVYQQSLKKHPGLDKHLKDVYVISNADNPKAAENPDRPLPADRKAVNDFEFGFKEPDSVPLGKVTLRKALQFITNHQTDPKKVTPASIAAEYVLPEQTVRNILKYFRVYEIYIPENRTSKAKFAGPSKPKMSVIKNWRKAIEAPKPN